MSGPDNTQIWAKGPMACSTWNIHVGISIILLKGYL
jgi:hypothetical protein